MVIQVTAENKTIAEYSIAITDGTTVDNPDTDRDGLSDGDGLSDRDEVDLETEPLNPDTDGGGLCDGDKVKYGKNPFDSKDNPKPV